MSYHNPPIPWRELERRISGRRPPNGHQDSHADQTGYRRVRKPFDRHPLRPEGPVVPYAELHCHSSYSFLDGASSPEDLVTRAVELGLSGLALTDHDGLYGVVRMAEAAEACGLPTIIGSELSIGVPEPQNGVADPVGSHLLVLANGPEGYRRLAGALTDAYLAEGGQKGHPVHDLNHLAEVADGHWTVLTGCRKGAVRQGLARGVPQAEAELHHLIDLFGTDNVLVELTDHRAPTNSRDNDVLAELAGRHGLTTVATTAAHYASAEQFELACALSAVRARRSLDEMDGWLPPGPVARLRSGVEMADLFSRHRDAVDNTVAVAERTAFQLRSVRPGLPDQKVPEGHTPISWLRHLVEEGRQGCYGDDPAAKDRLATELDLIEARDFAGYFLIVSDIVKFARSQGILCQGRGSAAASAVCYVLGITVVDPVFYGLPFERFLSVLREEEPDIDVDFDARRREEVIQYVYAKYGRRNAAQVAGVFTYRPRSAIRDMAKALGYSQGQQDAWSRQVERGSVSSLSQESDGPEIPDDVVALAQQVMGLPRHLGIHSAGMVLTQEPVERICPIEPARMPGRTVLQWDKEDCAWMGLVKFDLLGLGMLSALSISFDLISRHCGRSWTLASIPRNEPGIYDMLCRGDSIGIFQVESRAQIGTLPRLKPRCFYDLAVEIGLIRPGPVQGGAVHPYIRRRTGAEPITYPHPLLEPVLKRTLGIPLFQEQLMQMATTVGNCTAADADLLRRAMGSKRGVERIDSLRAKLFEGMAANGIDDVTARDIYARIESFANFGFAESHALSFAGLVYTSAWVKLHYPAAYLAALLRSQPMGFYSPATLVADARRHGVVTRRPDLTKSSVGADLEALDRGGDDVETGMDDCLHDHDESEIGPFDPDRDDGGHRRDTHFAVRLGLSDVSGISTETATRIITEREREPFTSLDDLARRVELSEEEVEALALAGVFDDLVGSRRGALWQIGQIDGVAPGQLDVQVATQPPLLPEPTQLDLLGDDIRATGISTADHPVRHVRSALDRRGVVRVDRLGDVEAGRRIEVAGVVTHRQRPGTAGGVTFLNVEDETGLLNVIVTPGAWKHHRRVARTSRALVVRGILERSDGGVTSLQADRLEALDLSVPTRSRDFH
ncbi:error-prone DNA polymerase [Cutibacterium avidum]|uniref:error-prone DNA polymerase n=1 Tax=Cutibacterium avidum TaxID=33010 RepID=UPI000A8500F5|nr:error-prone DNA polymerase [Cutibacterium avidum]MCT1416118.1 error-prone DNA polymerase [Cutibacterium avidum]MDQ9081797.1 error-prone DNA polymerase [Cutibacterium avidum]MDY0759502.1 error-prone DNA polymerase [Cutibacterium avidum]